MTKRKIDDELAEIEKENIQAVDSSKPLTLRTYAYMLIGLVVIGIIFWFVYSSTVNPNLTNSTTITSLNTTTTISTSTTTTTQLITTTTIDPLSLYGSYSVTNFIDSCNQSGYIVSPILQNLVKINGTAVEQFVAVAPYGKVLQLNEIQNAQKPATLDASGSTTYEIYGVSQIVSNSSVTCAMNVQRIVQTT